MLELRIGLDALHGFEAIHFRHEVIHENNVRQRLLPQEIKGFSCRTRTHNLKVLLFQQALQGDAGQPGVVHDESNLGHVVTLSGSR